MKKISLFIVSFFILTLNVNAAKTKVTLEKCVDGDTAWFKSGDEIIKARFLAIDTPESTIQVEEYGKEASKYTCDELTNAKKIELEYDPDSDKTDKYERHLVWVFVDGKLLQEKILTKGLAQVEYIYGDYKYLDNLYQVEKEAKKSKVGIWSDHKEDYSNYYFIAIVVIIVIFICIFSKTGRKEILDDIKKEAKKRLKKSLN